MLPVVWGSGAMAKLSKRVIDALEKRPTDYFEWDDELRGFGIRIWPSGGKTYIAQYRASGRTRRFKIGDHGVLTVEQARKEAKVLLGDVARGGDPANDRATRRKTLTVADLCVSYLAAAEKGSILGKRRTGEEDVNLGHGQRTCCPAYRSASRPQAGH